VRLQPRGEGAERTDAAGEGGGSDRTNGRRRLEETDTKPLRQSPCPLCCPLLRGVCAAAVEPESRLDGGATQKKKRTGREAQGSPQGDSTGTRRQGRSAVTRRVRAASVSAVPRGLCALPPSALVAVAQHPATAETETATKAESEDNGQGQWYRRCVRSRCGLCQSVSCSALRNFRR
jgi:hypothetical protein